VNHLTRIYLRGSTDAQDASRARSQVEQFAADHNLLVAGTYVENASGAKLARPELMRMLSDSKSGDIILVEAIDRLARLTDADWRKLRHEIESKGVRIISLDLPTSWQVLSSTDELTTRIFAAMNSLMLEILAATARADYDMRRRRAAQGIAKAKADGKYRGRPANEPRLAGIAGMLKSGMTWSEVCRAASCSRATVAKVARKLAIAAE
jgi:DNA invertase Pin-like site-specific DNA recombinase